jgi:hypothetical protein
MATRERDHLEQKLNSHANAPSLESQHVFNQLLRST